ncbi:MAG: 2-hydroxychromene-2-carboxylate isomerase [Myxococcota bacterium]
MTRNVDWYFDFVSPYPYLQLSRFRELPEDVVVRPRPVLFAALLNHWGHKGPAEIPAKKRQTYFFTRWLAASRGLPFAGPPRHPFNPLTLLRLCIAAGETVESVRTIYRHVWGDGRDGQDAESMEVVASALAIEDVAAATGDPAVKQRLHDNTAEAIARGVFGVPTFACQDELFWGDDATPLFVEFLRDPDLFRRPPYVIFERVTVAASR